MKTLKKQVPTCFECRGIKYILRDLSDIQHLVNCGYMTARQATNEAKQRLWITLNIQGLNVGISEIKIIKP